MTTRRVVTYERVSSEDQAERETIRTQTDALLERLKTEPSARFIARYADNGVSGTIPLEQRPDGSRLMAAARNGEFDELWVYRSDRLGRDALDLLYVRREMERLGIRIIAVVGGAQDPLTFDLLSVISDYERTVFLRRTADGMNRAAREGRYTGGIVPFGFRVEGERPHSVLVPDDSPVWGDMSAIDIVRKIYNLIAVKGLSCSRVADELNVLGIPTAYERAGRGIRGQATRGVWRAGRIRNLVVNPVYKGVLPYGRRSVTPGRIIITASIQGLVTEDVWLAAQATLAKNRHIPKNTTRTYLLRSCMVCEICGLKFVAVKGRGEKVWYRCGGKHSERGRLEGKCPSKQIDGRHIEGPVWADVERFLRNPDGGLIAELTAEVTGDTQLTALESEGETLRMALKDCEARRDRLIDGYSRGSLTGDDLNRILPQIQTEQDELQRRLNTLEERLQAEPEQLEPIDETLLETIRQRLDSGDLSEAERQEIVSLLVHRIVVHTEEIDGEKHVRAVIEYLFPRSVSTSTGTGSSRQPA